MILSPINADTTATLNLMQKRYEKFLATPLKVTYKKEFFQFFSPENIVEQLPDGKVIVEFPGSIIEQHVHIADKKIDRIETCKKTVDIDPQYNLPVDLTTTTVNLWMMGNKYYAEIYGSSQRVTVEVYDGAKFKQMFELHKRNKFGVTDNKPCGFDNIPSLLVWYEESWRTSKDKVVNIKETETEVIITEEWINKQHKREPTLDKSCDFIPRKMCYFIMEKIVGEYNYAGCLQIDEFYLPTQIIKKTFWDENIPNFFIFYQDLKWEKVSPELVAEKLSFDFPADVILSKKATK